MVISVQVWRVEGALVSGLVVDGSLEDYYLCMSVVKGSVIEPDDELPPERLKALL